MITQQSFLVLFSCVPRQRLSQNYNMPSFITCCQWNKTNRHIIAGSMQYFVICNLKFDSLNQVINSLNCSPKDWAYEIFILVTTLPLQLLLQKSAKKSCMEIRFMCHQICDQGLPWEICRHQICQQAKIERKKTQASVPSKSNHNKRFLIFEEINKALLEPCLVKV